MIENLLEKVNGIANQEAAWSASAARNAGEVRMNLSRWADSLDDPFSRLLAKVCALPVVSTLLVEKASFEAISQVASKVATLANRR
jgi:hypothetical protein